MAIPDENRTFTDSAGQIWPDPWGAALADVQAGGAPAGAAPAPAAPGGFELPPGFDASASPENTPTAPMGAPPAPQPDAQGFVTDPEHPGISKYVGSGPNMPPTPQPGFANKAGGGAAPTPQPGFADTLESSSSSRSSETGSTGLSDEAQKRQGANITQVAQGMAGAREATSAYGTLAAQQAEQQSARMLSEAASGIEKTAAQIALQDEIQRRVDTRMQAGADWRPNRAELFQGDHGVAFGLMAAVAAMAGAWMQGRGLTGSNPYLPTIMKMIDDNVQGQVRSNSANMQLLREQKGDIKAAIIELKQRQLHFAKMRLDGLAMKDSSDLMAAGVEKTRQDMMAQDAKWEQEKRQALERTETHKVTSSFSHESKPNPAATSERNEKQAMTQAAFDAAEAAYTKAGLIRDKDGKWRVGGGAFPPAMLEKLNPFSDDDILAHFDALDESFGRLQSGGVIGKDEAPRFSQMTGRNTTTRAQLAARANALENMMRARLKPRDEAANTERTTIPKDWK